MTLYLVLALLASWFVGLLALSLMTIWWVIWGSRD